MVYVIAELRNYRQLTRLRRGTLAALEAGLATALGQRSVPGTGPGIWIADLADEGELDAALAAAAAERVRDFLSSRREELFGFAVLVAALPPVNDPERVGRVRQLLDEAGEEERLWLAGDCAPLFEGTLTVEAVGSLFRVTGQVRHPAGEHPQLEVRPWAREALVSRALDMIAPRLNAEESRDVLLVHGPQGVGKTALIAELALQLVPPGQALPVLRARTIFRRRSPLHPFLGTLLPTLLSAVPRYLRGVEGEVWKEAGGMLVWLQGANEGSGDARPLPDHIIEDFTLAYQLYLLAWTRMAEEGTLPALFVCEGIETYHPAARRILGRLFENFQSHPSFLPVLSSVDPRGPGELAGVNFLRLFVHPLGQRQIRSLARHRFPGLEIPGSLARRLRRRSAGLYVPVVSYLQYLWKTGSIKPVADGWAWARAAEDPPALPASPVSVTWYLFRTLYDDNYPLLYALYLAGGLLDRQELLTFLAAAGFDAAAAVKSLGRLLSSGLIAEEGALIPRYPVLRRKLEELLGAEGTALRDRFISHIAALWSAGKYRHPVLLFTFFARNQRTDLALKVLPDIIRRKLDESDPAGARVFCDPRTLGFAAVPTQEQARLLAALSAVGRLRAALLEEDRDAAEAAQSEALKNAAADPRSILFGDVCIERAKFLLFSGDSLHALEELKKGLLLFQETVEKDAASVDARRGERACSLWLGATMLAEGRLNEAVEYLGLSQRLCHEGGDAFGGLWTQVYLADCLFMDGRFTQCLAAVEQGLEDARSIYRREIELFLLFLKARALFQVGAYEDCSLCLQACLCLATLFSSRPAIPILRAWLGRALVHQGEIESGTRLLDSLAQTSEVLLFQAEAALFGGGLENASLCVERGLAVPISFRYPPPEGIPWRNGYAGVEGRCFRLSRDDAYLRHSLGGLRAYLLGLRGFREEAIRELHQITRGERIAEADPAGYWLNYLYSRVLPEAATEETDDKVTVLSKALKSLQERASRIDAPAQRSSFLWRNRWNGMIMVEARDRKLV